MIEEHAVVLEVLPDGHIVVGKSRNQACGQCRTPCLELKTSRDDNPHLSLKVDAADQFRVGDQLVLGIAETGVLKAALKLYLLPVLGLLAGALTGHFSAIMTGWSDDGVSAAGAVTGLTLAIAAVRQSLRSKQSGEAEPVVVRRIP